MKYRIESLIAGICLLGSMTSTFAANPASKDYVDQQVNSLQTQINTINNGFKVGQFYQGGVIYWLDPTQSFQHGLIVDINNQSGIDQWSTASTTTNATNNGAFAGENIANHNTFIILHTSGATYPAAAACAASTNQGYTDWYLPSIMELSLMSSEGMAINQTAVAHGGSASLSALLSSQNPDYWSSTEIDSSNAMAFFFNTGQQSFEPKSNSYSVRCIRAF